MANRQALRNSVFGFFVLGLLSVCLIAAAKQSKPTPLPSIREIEVQQTVNGQIVQGLFARQGPWLAMLPNMPLPGRCNVPHCPPGSKKSMTSCDTYMINIPYSCPLMRCTAASKCADSTLQSDCCCACAQTAPPECVGCTRTGWCTAT
jgi:hypothetical protein